MMTFKRRFHCNFFIICLFVSGILFIYSSIAYAQVWVYDYLEMIVDTNYAKHKRSTLVRVEIEQAGEKHESFVMFDKNQQPSGNLAMNPDNHWTNFSMKGDVIVHVKRLDDHRITFCNIYPFKKGIQASVDGKTASFTITEDLLPLQLYVEMNDMPMDAILIFADPSETDVPSRDDSDVEVIYTSDDINTVHRKLKNTTTYKYFEKGVHQWGNETGPDYAGYKLPVTSGKKIYIPGGAYVIGSLSGDASDYKVYGRGIISAAGKDRIPGTSGIPYSLVQGDGASNTGIRLEGFVTLCPPHFALTIRGQVDIDNVKMLSWWHSTDGIVTGHNSTVRNCFFKVMDDYIKLYSDYCHHENNTMFHQVNGAPFQLCWGNQTSKNNTVVNTYIINSIYKNISGTGNSAVINARTGRQGNVTENMIWDGLYIDNGCHRLIGMEPKGAAYHNFIIKNVALNSGNKSQPQNAWSYLLDGIFSNFKFINLAVDGHPIVITNEERDVPERGALWFHGDSSVLRFE
jgi:hypothetical protein